MIRFKSFKPRVQAALAVLLLWGLASSVLGADPQAGPTSATNAAPVQASSPAAVKHQLTGAELYSIHCNRCHAERYPTERTAANWKTIMLHMQVRAALPGSQARLILQYLQDNSGR